MNKETKEKLKKHGWEITSVKEFLSLSEEDMKLIELRITLGKYLKEQRKKNGYTQDQLAKMIRSNQSRIAKMENGDNSVTIDALLKSLFYLGIPAKEISKVFAKI